MNAIHGLIAYLNRSDPNESMHKAALTMLQNIHNIKKMSIYELAETCFISPPSISRLIRALGFSSYADFKLNLSATIDGYGFLNRGMPSVLKFDEQDLHHRYLSFLREKLQGLEDSLDSGRIRQILDALHASSRVSFYCDGNVAITGFQTNLFIDNKTAAHSSNVADQLFDARTLNGDCFVLAAYPDLADSYPMLEVFKICKEKGSKLLIISSGRTDQVQKYADYLVCFEGTRTGMDSHLFSAFISILSIGYRNKYMGL